MNFVSLSKGRVLSDEDFFREIVGPLRRSYEKVLGQGVRISEENPECGRHSRKITKKSGEVLGRIEERWHHDGVYVLCNQTLNEEEFSSVYSNLGNLVLTKN